MRKLIYVFIFLFSLVFSLTYLHAGASGSSGSSETTSRLPGTEIQTEQSDIRLKIREVSQSLLGKSGPYLYLNGKKYINDCSGMVRAVFDNIGIDVFSEASQFPSGTNGVEIIYKTYRRQSWQNSSRTPKTGDLIIFNNTYDKNDNGRWDDKYTHVSVVTGVEENGSIVYIHHVSKGIQRYRMNLNKKGIYMEGGVLFNDFLRRRPSSDNDRTKYLSDNMFFAYVDVVGRP
ncbi:MAG: CHAP domain-containing protein [Leptospirales bacterium]